LPLSEFERVIAEQLRFEDQQQALLIQGVNLASHGKVDSIEAEIKRLLNG
jgi:ribosomal protein S4E